MSTISSSRFCLNFFLLVVLAVTIASSSSGGTADAAISPVPVLPPYMPADSLCFPHSEFVVCVGGDGTDTHTAFFSLTQFQKRNYTKGPTLKGYSLTGRAFAALAGNYLIVCTGCGKANNALYGDRLLFLDVAFAYDCLFRGQWCDRDNDFFFLIYLPSGKRRALSSIAFVPYTGNFGVEKGAVVLTGGWLDTQQTFSRESWSLEIELGPRIPAIVKKGAHWTSWMLPSFVGNMSDAPVAAFPMLERVILFYNATPNSGNPGVGATPQTYIVGKFNTATVTLDFATGSAFPGFLAPAASTFGMTNIVVDGHIAMFSSRTGTVWITDASETDASEGVVPARLRLYPGTVPRKATQFVNSLLMIPPGTDGGFNPTLAVAVLSDRSPSVPANLYPPAPPSIMVRHIKAGGRSIINMTISCFYVSTRMLRIAVAPDCSTPLNPSMSSIPCSITMQNKISINVPEGHRNVVLCVDKGRCPYQTPGKPSPVKNTTSNCPAIVDKIDKCMEHACCVNFESASVNKHVCLDTQSASSGLVQEFVPAMPLLVNFDRTATKSKSEARTLTQSHSWTPNTTTTTLAPTTTIPSNTGHSPSPGGKTPSPGDGNHNTNGSGLKVPIIATASGLGFIGLVSLIYVLYRRCGGRSSNDSNNKKKRGGGFFGGGDSDSERSGGGGSRSGNNTKNNNNNSSNTRETTPRLQPKPGSADPMSIIPQFSIVNKIGRGGFGDVYAVRRKTDGEVYALKVYRLQSVADSASDEGEGAASDRLGSGENLGSGNNDPPSQVYSARAESALSAEAFNSHGSPIVRVATLQKVGALAFKEQRIMRKLHRETHGRVVKPIEVYVHGSMEAPSDQLEPPPALNLNSTSNDLRTSSSMGGGGAGGGGASSSSMMSPTESSSPPAHRGGLASAVPASAVNEQTPLLAGNRDNNGGIDPVIAQNRSMSMNTAELATTNGDSPTMNAQPDPQQPISYSGSIVAGLFELIPDGNFYTYLKSFEHSNKRPPLPTVLRVLCQLADVLHIMNVRSAGTIVHGDIKAENVLLKISQGNIVLGDFGTAVEFRRSSASRSRTSSGMEREGPLMGKALSLIYAPPERVQGVAAADPALDWWSFGVLCYLCFAPKGRHARTMAMDMARANKQSSSLGAADSKEAAKMRDEIVVEVTAGGLPEALARNMMLPCLNLQPAQRLKPNMARDLLQQELLALYPDAEQRMENAPTYGLFDSPYPFDLPPTHHET